MPAKTPDQFANLQALLKRRGFIFPSSELYGGTGGVYDYGTLGVLLRNNLRAAWLNTFVRSRDDMALLDSAILMRREVWQASGHEQNFNDPLVECPNCKSRFREDHLLDGEYGEVKLTASGQPICPKCGHELGPTRQFNMMFKTFLGPAEDTTAQTYLRPETAQGIFVNFRTIWETARQKLPFGVAQIGKAFRNEITIGNFVFRVREFEQMEIEWFIQPDEATEQQWFDYWFKAQWQFFVAHGLNADNMIVHTHAQKDLAHYSRGTTDINYRWPFGEAELSGLAKRGSYDLDTHAKASKQELAIYDEQTKQKVVPWVIEPSFGFERAMLAFLLEAYTEYPTGRGEKAGMEEPGQAETVLHLSPKLAPYTLAVLPLVKKQGLPEKAKEVTAALRQYWNVAYDESASIGRRYRRQDEVGTPWCVTVDFQTLEDNSVTIRDRDSMAQRRIAIPDLVTVVWEELLG